ncbi:glycosyltransferase [Rhodococcus sp. ACPA4]|uniref:glycosyltransferase n=1 Tax=Rhodococcus sp. ACPA4 TaxID=2028571 RepID=UPI0015CAC2D9|nr:glycosyltransferase [Rhodococcus sp. ACPA4]
MSASRELHIVEPGGQGGVYQHVLGAIQNREFAHYERVVLHTARDAEVTPDLHGLSYCRCMRYQRHGSHPVRAALSLAWVGLLLLPHLTVTAIGRRNSDWEIQGLFGKFVYPIMILIAKGAGHRVTWAPHNSFSRNDSGIGLAARQFAGRIADDLVVYVESERSKFNSSSIELRRLWQYIAPTDDAMIADWRIRLGAGNPIVVFAGQLRADKNPLLLIEAANRIPDSLTIVFAGQDKGAAAEIQSDVLAEQHTLIFQDRYLELSEFQSLISAADVIVCPYAVASQSGVVAVAVQLGKKVIASNVGGLSEQTPYTFELESGSPATALASAIEAALRQPLSTGPPRSEAPATQADPVKM